MAAGCASGICDTFIDRTIRYLAPHTEQTQQSILVDDFDIWVDSWRGVTNPLSDYTYIACTNRTSGALLSKLEWLVDEYTLGPHVVPMPSDGSFLVGIVASKLLPSWYDSELYVHGIRLSSTGMLTDVWSYYLGFGTLKLSLMGVPPPAYVSKFRKGTFFFDVLRS